MWMLRLPMMTGAGGTGTCGQKTVDSSREKWTPVEPAGTCPGYESLKLGGSEDPWTTGARDEHSTIGGGRLACPCGAGDRGDRPDAPQRLCADAADGGGGGGLLARPPGPAICVDGGGGADDRGVRTYDRGVRRPRRHRPGDLRQAAAQGRRHAAAPAALRGDRRRALCRQGPGEGAGDAHGASPQREDGGNLSVDRGIHRDGQPLLFLLRR